MIIDNLTIAALLVIVLVAATVIHLTGKPVR
jgi:hypothetical protein